MAAFCFHVVSIALMLTGAAASKHSNVAYRVNAQATVATMVKERRSKSSSSYARNFEGWLPVVASEAEQGKLPHQDIDREFRDQFAEVIGVDDMQMFEKDLQSIMHELSDTFASLSKNEYGDVGHTAVRYSLHRLFVARHGWYIRGLDPEGKSFSSSSPAEVLQGQVPDDVQKVIEKLLDGRGFGLYETAVLAAVLENLIHKEAIFKAATVFSTFGMTIEDFHPSEKIDFAIDHYMASYIMGRDVVEMTRRDAERQMSYMNKGYPGWKNTQEWTRSIRRSYGHGDFSFNDTVAVLVEIGETYGKWQQKECVGLKKLLMGLEDEKNGCVPVSHFYKRMVEEGKWEFSESPDYLKDLGALDDSDPNDLKVMIPNYLDSASNCVASSSYYSVCCVNECEDILGRIEHYVQGPDASPEELASFVSTIASSTVAPKRKLSASLVKHLNHIADLHGGRVPIHSRLFAQWMHNAYPHECPYPHMAGTTNPMTPEMWLEETGVTSKLPIDKMKSYIAEGEKEKDSFSHRHAQCGKWLDAEELYVPWTLHKNVEVTGTYFSSGRFGSTTILACGGVLSTMVFVIVHVYRNFGAANYLE